MNECLFHSLSVWQSFDLRISQTTLDSFPQGEFLNHLFLAGKIRWNFPSLIPEHLYARSTGYWFEKCVILGSTRNHNLLLDALGY